MTWPNPPSKLLVPNWCPDITVLISGLVVIIVQCCYTILFIIIQHFEGGTHIYHMLQSRKNLACFSIFTHVGHGTNWLSIALRCTIQTSLPNPRVHSCLSWNMNVEFCLYTYNSDQVGGGGVPTCMDKLINCIDQKHCPQPNYIVHNISWLFM